MLGAGASCGSGSRLQAAELAAPSIDHAHQRSGCLPARSSAAFTTATGDGSITCKRMCEGTGYAVVITCKDQSNRAGDANAIRGNVNTCQCRGPKDPSVFKKTGGRRRPTNRPCMCQLPYTHVLSCMRGSASLVSMAPSRLAGWLLAAETTTFQTSGGSSCTAHCNNWYKGATCTSAHFTTSPNLACDTATSSAPLQGYK